MAWLGLACLANASECGDGCHLMLDVEFAQCNSVVGIADTVLVGKVELAQRCELLLHTACSCAVDGRGAMPPQYVWPQTMMYSILRTVTAYSMALVTVLVGLT